MSGGTGRGVSMRGGVGGLESGSDLSVCRATVTGSATASTIEPIRIARRVNFAENANFSICSSVGTTIRLVAAITSI
jgi:hypothetical protein